ncbi:7,8-dihydro-8-oxoguanine triphosphatase [Favolaschia claudopus]|uniref:Oxidized purine nucleoside triphosphate hydrolase n=1 Tax=Favolaschia claudopus TaxID=2862362 RepID=A0AAW0D645_9AGAR
MSPPGLPSDLREVAAWGSSSDDWFPPAEIRYYTNAFIVKDNRILLGYKKRGLGIHKYNGFGGKVEPSESPLDAAQRELQEEAGITAPLAHAGTLLFVVPGEKWAHIDIFRAEDYTGAITESDEMRPEWFDQDNVPFDNMWESDRHWLPLLLTNQRFSARADFVKEGGQYVPRRWWVGISETIGHNLSQKVTK